jgi:hypothetical protein
VVLWMAFAVVAGLTARQHLDMPHVRPDGVRSAAQHPLHDTRRAGYSATLQQAVGPARYLLGYTESLLGPPELLEHGGFKWKKVVNRSHSKLLGSRQKVGKIRRGPYPYLHIRRSERFSGWLCVTGRHQGLVPSAPSLGRTCVCVCWPHANVCCPGPCWQRRSPEPGTNRLWARSGCCGRHWVSPCPRAWS